MDRVKKVSFEISANGVYRSIRYLYGIDIYVDDNGWIIDSEVPKKKYTYGAIKRYLETECTPLYNRHYKVYDGDYVWKKVFLADPDLEKRIHHMGFTSLAQLQHYANKAACRD